MKEEELARKLYELSCARGIAAGLLEAGYRDRWSWTTEPEALREDWRACAELAMQDQHPRACVVGVVRDDVGRILLGRRLKRDDGYGKWVLPGGGIEGRETFAAALEREIREECGLAIGVGEILGAYRHIEGSTNNVIVLFNAYAPAGQEPRGGDDLEAPRFFSPYELSALDADAGRWRTTLATLVLLELAGQRIPRRGAVRKPPAEGAG